MSAPSWATVRAAVLARASEPCRLCDDDAPAFTSPPPPGMDAPRWQRLVDAGRHFDAIANRGAGAPKDAG